VALLVHLENALWQVPHGFNRIHYIRVNPKCFDNSDNVFKGQRWNKAFRAVKEKCSLPVRKVKDKNFAELTMHKQHNWDFPLRRFNIHNAVKFHNKWLELSFCITTLFKIVCFADLEWVSSLSQMPIMFHKHNFRPFRSLCPFLGMVCWNWKLFDLRVRVVIEHAVPLFSVEGLEPLPVPPLEQLAHPPVVFPTSALLAAY